MAMFGGETGVAVAHKLIGMVSPQDTVIAAMLVSFPLWDQWLQSIHEGAAYIAPVVGVALGLTQIVRNIVEVRRTRR